MRILAANPDGLGDLMLRQPLYAALLAAGHELMLTVRPASVPIVAHIAPSAKIAILDVDPYQLSIHPDYDKLQPVLDATKSFAPDLFLVTPFQWTLAEEWLAANLPGVRVVGFHGHLFSNDPRWGVKAQSNLRFDTQIEIPENSLEIDKNQAIASELLGKKIKLADPHLSLTKENLAPAKAQLKALKLQPDKYWVAWVGHAPYTPLRNWRLENWADVLGYWISKHHRKFLLVGTEEESQTTELVRSAVVDAPPGAIVSLCRDTPLETIAGLIQFSSGYIGRDTGPMHLAAAAGKPVIAVFGGGTWPRFVPAVDRSWAAMVNVPCIGCGWRCPFDQSYCIKQVPVKDVRDAIDDMERGRIKGRVVRSIKPPREMTGDIVRQMMVQIENKTFETHVAVTNHNTNQQQWESRMASTVETFTAGVAAIRQPLEDKITAVAGGVDALRDERAQLQQRLAQEQENISRLQNLLDENTRLIKQLDARRAEEAAAMEQQHHAAIGAMQQTHQSSVEALNQATQTSLKSLEQSNRSIADELASAQSKLEHAQRDLSTERDRATQLESQAHANELIFQEQSTQFTQTQSHLAVIGEELAANRFQLQDMRDRWDDVQKEMRALKTALAAYRPPPVNRRPWPWSAPQAIALPSTLPGGKTWPRISIVTPSFNQGKHIEQTILSILNQNYPNLQYILIDGGSTDETMAIVDRYRESIDYIVSEKDAGQSSAINKGFAGSDGELLTWINSDDMLEPGALAAMAMAFHTSNADVIAGVCTLHSDGKILGRHLTACGNGPLPVDDLLDLESCWLKGQFFYQPEVMFTRKIWDRSGGKVDEELYYSMDYDLWLRFAKASARLHVIGRPIALYRVHEQQKTFAMQDYQPELFAVRDRYAIGSAPLASRNGHAQSNRSHLRILFFNDLGGAGGAGIAHQRLATAVATAGHVVIPLAICPQLIESELTNDQILHAIEDRTPDIVFLGNIHSAQLDPALIGLISARWPTIQILHDLFSLTGRCAYPGDCTKYLTGCDASCPTAHEYPLLEPALIRGAWETKHQAMTASASPILAAVSDWTENFARQRYRGEANSPKFVGIRYGLPTDIFRPRDKSMCRDMLGLPQDRFIVLFSASHLADQRKGLGDLIKALEKLKLPNLLACCVGHFDVGPKVAEFEVRGMGYVSDPHTLSVLYSAVDLFVGPSKVETFGQVFIEAAACGTPSIGYTEAGGVAEACLDNVSGLLAAEMNWHDLARAICRLHDDPQLRQNLSAWGSLWAQNEFSFRSSYQRIFAQLNKIGLLQKLHIAPKVSFHNESISPPPVFYLDPAAGAAPVQSAPIDTNFSLAHRLAAAESERDSLLVSIEAMRKTRLWRLVSKTYPLYQRVLGTPKLPRAVRRSIQGMGTWLAERPRNPQS